MKEKPTGIYNMTDEGLRTITPPKYVGTWILGDLCFAVTKMPSWRMRLMMKIFFDWGFKKN
jgi:hypothetical protein